MTTITLNLGRAEAVASTPTASHAEQAYLGCLLLDTSCINAGVTVDREGFMSRSNRATYDAMQKAVEDSVAVDPVTLGGYGADPKYCAELLASCASVANVDHYAAQINDAQLRRDMIKAARAVEKEAVDGESADDALAAAQTRFLDLSADIGASEEVDYGEIFSDFEAAYEAGTGLTGITTGLSVLDDWTAGLQNGDLVILAARPSCGKTALAVTNIAVSAAKDGKRVGVFSLEMSEKSLKNRIVAAEAGVNGFDMRRGKLEDSDIVKLPGAINDIKNTFAGRLLVNDKSGITMPEIGGQLRQWSRDGRVDMVVVDYIQLMGAAGRQQNRNLEVGAITRAMKNMAREYDIPFVALSQLSREVEKRKGPPVLSDLRDSGEIEQDADVVMFIHREKSKEVALSGIVPRMVIIAKQRNGPIGHKYLGWDTKRIMFV